MNLYWVKTWNLYHPVKQRNKKTQIKAFNHSNNKTRVNFFLYDVHSPSNTTSLWSYLCQILLFAFQLYATPLLPFWGWCWLTWSWVSSLRPLWIPQTPFYPFPVLSVYLSVYSCPWIYSVSGKQNYQHEKQ